jgi:hypothetical protein
MTTGAPARVIDGKAFAARLREKVASEVAGLRARGVAPGLAVVLVGEDPASQVLQAPPMCRGGDGKLRAPPAG